MIRLRLVVTLGCWLLACGAWGQLEADTTQADTAQKHSNFSALPTAYYTPETRIALEGFAYFSFQTDTAARKSNVRMFAAVTQNRQLTLDLPWQVFSAGEQFRIDGKVDVKKFPEYYWHWQRHREATTYEYRGVFETAP